MTTRVLRVVGIAFAIACLALAAGVTGPALGSGSAPGADRATGPMPSIERGPQAGSTAPAESSPSGVNASQVNDRSVPASAAGGQADRITRERSDRGERPSRRGALPAPFAQADDDSDGAEDDDSGDSDEDGGETHVINISAPDEEIEYALAAPDLEPAGDVDIVDGDGNESNQDVIRGDSATGFIGNGNYDAYRFTGSVDRVRLDSNRIDDLEVTIDGEPVDPRTLTGTETETTAIGTGTDTAAETATQSTDTSAAPTTATGTGTADTATDSSPTTASGPATTTASGGQSGRSGFGMVMFVLIGIVSGLVLAGALVYVVRSDRSD